MSSESRGGGGRDRKHVGKALGRGQERTERMRLAYYKKEGETLRPEITEGRDFAVSSESEEKTAKKEGERQRFAEVERTGGWASEQARGEKKGGGGGGACLEAQPVGGQRGTLWGESYPGNTIDRKRRRTGEQMAD